MLTAADPAMPKPASKGISSGVLLWSLEGDSGARKCSVPVGPAYRNTWGIIYVRIHRSGSREGGAIHLVIPEVQANHVPSGAMRTQGSPLVVVRKRVVRCSCSGRTKRRGSILLWRNKSPTLGCVLG